MRWGKEMFGVKVRDEVKTLVLELLNNHDEVNEIQLSGEGIKLRNETGVSNKGFRLKQSEILYIKRKFLKSKKDRWQSETKIVEGDAENFGKVEVLTKMKKIK